jgi:hypothetical protein
MEVFRQQSFCYADIEPGQTREKESSRNKTVEQLVT